MHFVGQTWTSELAGVPQGSILDLCFFLVYINDTVEGISSATKLFSDGTSTFSVVNDITVSTDQINKDFKKI